MAKLPTPEIPPEFQASSPGRILNLIFSWAMILAFTWILLDNYTAIVMLSLCAGMLTVFLCRRVEIPRFGLVAFALALFLRLGVVLALHPPVESDFAVLLEASQLFRDGDYSFQSWGYFQNWAGQTGQVIFQGLLLRIWSSPMAIKLVNCLAASGTVVLVYFIARRFFQESAARAASLFHCVSALPLTMVSVLTNQHTATFLTFLGVYLLLGAPVDFRADVCVGGGAVSRPDLPLGGSSWLWPTPSVQTAC